MARLTDTEKAQLLRAAKRSDTRPPPARLRTPADYIEFATFASRFNRASKPVRFTGKNWKL